MKRLALPMLLATLLSTLATIPVTATEEIRPWFNTERDVWIDLELTREVTTYRESGTSRLLVLSDRLGDAVIVDPDLGVVSTVSREQIALDVDLDEVHLDGHPVETSGFSAATEDGVILAEIAGRDVLIGRHQSPVGRIDVDELLRDYPVWKAKMEAYVPDPEIVKTLAALEAVTKIEVVFATWCGDSRREVPALLASVRAAANPNLSVELIGIDADFHAPLDLIHERRITNVPTIILSQNDREIGRVVETPASATLEADLLALLERRGLMHPGRWARGDRLSRGVYELHLDDGSLGDESWEIFETAGDGRLMHSVIRTGLFEREIWHRLDALGRTEFVEITDRHGDEIQRSRIRVGPDQVRVTSRGSRSGIIDQVLKSPAGCMFSTGSVLSEGLACDPFRQEEIEVVRYSVPLEDCTGIGCLETTRLVRGASTSIDSPLGKVAVERIETATGPTRRTIWLDPLRGVPIRMEESKRRAVLVDFEERRPV